MIDVHRLDIGEAPPRGTAMLCVSDRARYGLLEKESYLGLRRPSVRLSALLQGITNVFVEVPNRERGHDEMLALRCHIVGTQFGLCAGPNGSPDRPPEE